MKLYLVRHGESIGNTKQGFISGQTDPEGLSPKGRIQIIRTSWELKNESFDQIYSSPVSRAQETASILSSYLGTPIKTVDWLTELHHGIFEGYYWWEVIHKIPPSWRARREDFRTPYPKGESMELLIKRVSEGLEKWLPTLNEDGSYMVVSHQAVITTIRYCLEHGDYSTLITRKAQEDYLKYLHEVKLDNGCIAQLTLRNDKLLSTKEIMEFEAVKPNKNSIAFYAKELLRVKDNSEAERMETASGNSVYKLQLSTPKLMKVVRDKNRLAFERQINLYRYLNHKKVPSPVIETVDMSQVFFSHDVLIQDYVAGDVIKKCFMDHPQKVDSLLEKVYQALIQIHELPVDEVKDFWKPPLDEQFTQWKNYMLLNINMTLHVVQEKSVTKDIYKKIAEALSCLKDYVREERYALEPIHGDVGSDNIIVHHNKSCQLVRLIDFEWARIGDGLWDFAYFWGWLERNNTEVAEKWKKLLLQHLPDQMIQLEWYRILFHAWTVRDMMEYKDNPIRLRRGKKSFEILETL
mgnify:CR=1 FL=1